MSESSVGKLYRDLGNVSVIMNGAVKKRNLKHVSAVPFYLFPVVQIILFCIGTVSSGPIVNFQMPQAEPDNAVAYDAVYFPDESPVGRYGSSWDIPAADNKISPVIYRT